MEKGLILAGSDLKRLTKFKKGTKVALPAAFYADRFPREFERNQPFTAGLAASFINDSSYLKWPDFQRLADSGVEIASAGLNHRNLLFRNALHPSSHYMKEVKAEIIESKQLIEQHLGRGINGFIYPSGFYDDVIKRLVKRAGYKWALTSTQGVNTPDSDLYELKRIEIELDDTPETVRQKIKGRFRLKLARHPLISVIIPTYNRKRLLEPVLKSLMDQNYPLKKFEVIVVDDGGSDGSDRLVKELGKQSDVKLRYFWQEDLGFRAGTARNLGAKHAKGELLLFLDGDVVAHPDLLLQHARFHNRWPNKIILGYVCAHTSLNTYNVPDVIKAVENKTLKELPLQPELRDSIYSSCLNDLDHCHRYWMAFFSNNVSMAKTIFKDVGGFDDSFHGWGIEDNEMGYRLAQAGYRSIVARQAVSFHIGTEGELLNPYLSPDEKKFRALRDNMQRFYNKYRHQEVKRFLVGLNVKVPEKYRLFKDEPDTHDVILGGECNNACTVCEKLGKKGQFRPVRDILDELESFANRKTVWLRGGEPTLRDDFFEIIGSAKCRGFEQIGVLTNGRAFAYMDFARKAIQEGATQFEIQLYGHSPEVHDSITNIQGSFEQTLNGIRNLQALGALVIVNMVICKQNQRFKGALHDFAESLGLFKVRTIIGSQGALNRQYPPFEFTRVKGALLNKVYTGPDRVLICITKRCNTNCDFCPFHRDETRQKGGYLPSLKGEISLEKFKELVEDLGVMGTNEIGIIGDGEPLMHPDLIEMVQAAKKQALYVTIYTNGVLLDKRMAEALCEAGLDSLHVNLSAGSREVYEEVHPNRAEDFDNLVAQLKYITKLKQEKRWNLNLTLVQVITRITYKDIANMINVTERVGADTTLFKPYIYFGCLMEMSKDSHIMRKKNLEEFRQMMPSAEEQFKASGKPSNFQELKEAFLRSDNNLYTEGVYEETPCLIGWCQSQISSGGDVGTCCLLHATMGNINEQRFRDIWFSEKYNLFRTKTRDGTIPRSAEVCQRCENYQDNKALFDSLASIREHVYSTHPKPKTLI